MELTAAEIKDAWQPVLRSNEEQRRDFVYVDDLIDMAIRVGENTGFGCFNIIRSINEL